MRRVVIVGATGSGKSTLAEALALKLHLEIVDLDELSWLPGWQLQPIETFAHNVSLKVSMEKWIITGNYSKVREIVWSRADTIIWLNYPFPSVLSQLLLRSVRRIRDQTLICNGNRETWKKFFSNESIVLWLLRSYSPKVQEYRSLLDAPSRYPGVRMIELQSRSKTTDFLNTVK